MLSLIWYNGQRRRNYSHIFIVTVILISITSEAVNINDEVTTETPLSKRRPCCSFKKFVCNNETSPIFIECHDETDQKMVLSPDKYPEDNYTLSSTRLSDGTEIRELITASRNYSDSEFCLGWRKEPSDNKLYESAIVCYNSPYDEEYDFIENHLSFILNGMCLTCSVFFSLITLIIYCSLPWLRDLQGKIIMSLLVSLCLAYSTLSYVQITANVPDKLCVVIGYIIYYWCFSIFTWLHVSSFNIWRTVVLSRHHYKIFQNTKRLFYVYSLFAWGVPFVFLMVALLMEFVIPNTFHTNIRPHMGESRCWFHSRESIWVFFYGPLLVIILSNILYFISVVNRLHRIEKVQLRRKALSSGNLEITKNNELARKSVRKLKKLNKMMNKNKLYLKLFFAMGITFIFELISDLYLNNLPHLLILRILFLIMDTVNALLGLILFIVLVLTRKNVLLDIFKRMNIPIKYLPFKNYSNEEDQEDNDGEGEGEQEGEEEEDFETDDDEENNLTNTHANRQSNALKITNAIQMT